MAKAKIIRLANRLEMAAPAVDGLAVCDLLDALWMYPSDLASEIMGPLQSAASGYTNPAVALPIIANACRALASGDARAQQVALDEVSQLRDNPKRIRVKLLNRKERARTLRAKPGSSKAGAAKRTSR